MADVGASPDNVRLTPTDVLRLLAASCVQDERVAFDILRICLAESKPTDG